MKKVRLLKNRKTISFSSHIENDSLSRAGFSCPQCNGRYCELPVECKQCGLTLVSAPHLARSYHHLFPLKPYAERENTDKLAHWFACAKPFSEDKYVSLHSACCFLIRI